MLKILYLIFLSVLLFSNAVTAQNKYSADNIDSITAKLLENKNWNQLITYGQQAISKGVVSYELYTRLGLAYYKTQKFFDAVPCFEKAIELTYNDPLILRYLYYSYKKTEHTEDKNFIFNDLSERIRRKEKPFENSLMDNLHVMTGKIFSNDINKNSDVTTGYANNKEEKIFNGDEFYFNAGFNQMPLRWVSITYDYTYGKLSKKKEIQNDTIKYKDDYSQYQNRFYNKFDIRLATGLILSPAGHYISVKDNTIYSNPDSNTVSRQEKFSDDFILSLEIAKYFSVFKAGVNGSFSFLNGTHQSQFGLTLRSFPFGKINFYTNTSVTLHTQNKISDLVFSQSVSAKLYKNLWGSANVSVGKMNNFNEQNGFVIYNTNDITKYKLGAGLKYYFPYNLTARITYDYQSREKNFSDQTYNANSIYAGINFGF